MSGETLCVEFAREKVPAGSGPETLAAYAIWEDVLDRRRLKWEFERIDDEVKQEILRAWSEIIMIAKQESPHDR